MVRTISVSGNQNFVLQVSPRPLTFHIGAQAGQSLSTQINTMSSEALQVDKINLTDQNLANQAIRSVDMDIQGATVEMFDHVSLQDYIQSMRYLLRFRLESTISNLQVASLNLQNSESQIRDLDYSKEVIEFVTSQILFTSATSFLRQSNSLSNNVLELLG